MKSSRTYFKDIPSSVYHAGREWWTEDTDTMDYLRDMRRRKPSERESFEDWFEASYIRHAMEWEDTKNMLNWWVTR